MNGNMIDENLRRLIKRRAIKNNRKRDGDIISYGGRRYFVNLEKDIVVLQLERK